MELPGPLDLEATLHSGQAFRWTRDGSAHVGFIDNVPVRLWAQDGRLLWRSQAPITRHRIVRYLRLDESHDGFHRRAPDDPYLRRAVAAFSGLRLLRQDPWETLISFIISQNSNETKIRGTIEKLARMAGEQVVFDGREMFRFPTPNAIAALSEAELRTTGMGYRAAYVRDASRSVVDGSLRPADLPSMDYAMAFDALLRLHGVGEKVADCILLYGCDHLQAFPTDVWVRRFVHETYYRPRRAATHERLRAFAWRHFGQEAGYAQHFLFHYRRIVGRLDANPE